MSTLYKSILIQQPTDGDTVFIRRFTRDPPVLATWDATAQQFTLISTATITIIGGTYAGIWPVTFTPNVAGTGNPAWFNLQGSIYLAMIEGSPGAWVFQQTDFATAAYFGNNTFATAPNRTETSFSSFGSPAWSGPTSMATNALTGVALIIPASLVQAWRPQ